MRASVAFILLDLFLVVVCWKKRKNKTKQTSNPSSLFSHLQLGPTVLPDPTAPRGPPSLSPLFSPPYQKQVASPTCSSGLIATAGPLHPLPLSLSLTPRPHASGRLLPPAAAACSPPADCAAASPASPGLSLPPTELRINAQCTGATASPPFPKPTLHRLHHH
jgi:hypothetical protein